MPCPLCWLRSHGYWEQISDPHTKADWDWLAEHQQDPAVRQALASRPSGVRILTGHDDA